ncbi:MAG: GMC family oxidoreductase N-terminal domain-containing protein, partial [Pseudomonadota bacterium]
MTVSDFVVVGAGSAGSVAAAGLAQAGHTVTLIESGPSERHPLVKMPFGLFWLMGRKARDWCFQSTPQPGLGGRSIGVPRGRMVGGSGSINSMVWFRGQKSDFDGWAVPGWGWDDVCPAFEAVEAQLKPTPIARPHALVSQLYRLFGGNGDITPDPSKTGFGRFRYNMSPGRRRSAADAFLRPAMATGRIRLVTGVTVDRLELDQGQARSVMCTDGQQITAGQGVVICAGSIGSPAILMRSGIGPAGHLQDLGIPVVFDAPQVGQNLHDHPGVGLHFAGPRSGYGLTWGQAMAWAVAPLAVLFGRGRFASPTVEGGGFFNARGIAAPPDVQTHFIPFKFPNPGAPGRYGAGYFA